MKAHESIFELVACERFDIFLVKVFGHGVVNIEQSHGVFAYTGADVFA